MGKPIIDDEETGNNDETVVDAKDREIVISVNDEGGYKLTLTGNFNVVELYSIIEAVFDRIKVDYRNFMEQTIFASIVEKK